jgi:cation diffusion facilitator CzcD-associated flavoprotein CzcO
VCYSYSTSEEIWQYFKDVAVKYDLEKYVKFEHKVNLAKWNEEKGKWELNITKFDGTEISDECEILVNCSGILK